MRKSLHKTQLIADDFLKRWRNKHIPLRKQRSKWFRRRRLLLSEDMAFMCDQLLPCNLLCLDMVAKLYPDDEGNVSGSKTPGTFDFRWSNL